MLAPYFEKLESMDPIRPEGCISEIVGLVIESVGPPAAIGDLCEIQTSSGRMVRSQVIGFRSGRVLSMPLEDTGGLKAGDKIIGRAQQGKIAVGQGLLGRVLDGFGQPMDGRGPIQAEAIYNLHADSPGPLEREPITEPLVTGIRVIDSLLTCGKGQRIGIFGGSGVGKSTLLGAMSRNNSAHVSVIALIGERNREVRDFLEHGLGPEGLGRSVVIASTSERPAPLRIRAAFVALAVSEYFRDCGCDVLLVMDSVTRLAMAQREIGLAAGEPPSQRGYTPSVFNMLPKVFERAGRFRKGSITGFFTVLVEGDDFNEPVCDAVRGILDGHIILSRELGVMGHYPAIDVLQSVSRLAPRLAGVEDQEAARKIREILATYQRAEDLINLGAYTAGSNQKLDVAIRVRQDLLKFLQQDAAAKAPLAETLSRLREIASAC